METIIKTAIYLRWDCVPTMGARWARGTRAPAPCEAARDGPAPATMPGAESHSLAVSLRSCIVGYCYRFARALGGAQGYRKRARRRGAGPRFAASPTPTAAEGPQRRGKRAANRRRGRSRGRGARTQQDKCPGCGGWGSGGGFARPRPRHRLATMLSAFATKSSPLHSASLASPTRAFLAATAARCLATRSVWVVK